MGVWLRMGSGRGSVGEVVLFSDFVSRVAWRGYVGLGGCLVFMLDSWICESSAFFCIGRERALK